MPTAALLPDIRDQFQTLFDENDGRYLTYQTYYWLFFEQISAINWLSFRQLLSANLSIRLMEFKLLILLLIKIEVQSETFPDF